LLNKDKKLVGDKHSSLLQKFANKSLIKLTPEHIFRVFAFALFLVAVAVVAVVAVAAVVAVVAVVVLQKGGLLGRFRRQRFHFVSLLLVLTFTLSVSTTFVIHSLFR
jgi:hypothetical protein